MAPKSRLGRNPPSNRNRNRQADKTSLGTTTESFLQCISNSLSIFDHLPCLGCALTTGFAVLAMQPLNSLLLFAAGLALVAYAILLCCFVYIVQITSTLPLLFVTAVFRIVLLWAFALQHLVEWGIVILAWLDSLKSLLEVGLLAEIDWWSLEWFGLVMILALQAVATSFALLRVWVAYREMFRKGKEDAGRILAGADDPGIERKNKAVQEDRRNGLLETRSNFMVSPPSPKRYGGSDAEIEHENEEVHGYRGNGIHNTSCELVVSPGPSIWEGSALVGVEDKDGSITNDNGHSSGFSHSQEPAQSTMHTNFSRIENDPQRPVSGCWNGYELPEGWIAY